MKNTLLHCSIASLLKRKQLNNPPAIAWRRSNWRAGATMKQLTRGFTLIEILVVISIIGVLAAFLLSQFSGIRERTRDTQRKADLRQIQSALELFRADNGCYPDSTCTTATLTNPVNSCNVQFVTTTGTVYMENIPCDPTGDSGGISNTTSCSGGECYRYTSSGRAYNLYACLENANDPDLDTSGAFTCSTGRVLFSVHNP